MDRSKEFVTGVSKMRKLFLVRGYRSEVNYMFSILNATEGVEPGRIKFNATELEHLRYRIKSLLGDRRTHTKYKKVRIKMFSNTRKLPLLCLYTLI